MEENRLPFKASKTLYTLYSRGKATRASNVRECLCRYGFSNVWNKQGVECVNGFLQCFRNRIVDCRWQDQDDHVQTSDRFCFHSIFKTSNVAEPFFWININRFVKCALAKLRFGISAIVVHSQRYSRSPSANDLMCHLFKSACEDEVHFVLCWPALENLIDVY